jgi:hypothetical protein
MLEKRRRIRGYYDTEYNDFKSTFHPRHNFSGDRIRRYNCENSLTLSASSPMTIDEE